MAKTEAARRPKSGASDIGRRLSDRVGALLGDGRARAARARLLRIRKSKGATVAVFDLDEARRLGVDVAYEDGKLRLRHRRRHALVDLSTVRVRAAFRPEALTLVLEPAETDTPEGGDRMQAAFVRQAVVYLSELAKEMGDDAVAAALAEPSPNRSIARALQTEAAVRVLQREDPLLQATLRGLSERERLLEDARGALDLSDVVRILGISRQAVDKRRREGKLLALRRGDSRYVYPAIQFAGSRTVPGLERLLAELREFDAWTVLSFLMSPNEFLERRRPIDVLREDGLEEVLPAARGLESQGPA